MTQTEVIIKTLMDMLNFTSTLSNLYSVLSFPKSSIRRVLSNLTKNGIIDRVDKGVYKLIQVYREVLHTKRIIDTNSVKPIHKFDIDVESTSIGRVPSWLSLKEIEKVLNPKLIDATIDQLGREGILLMEEYVTFKIMGTQFRDANYPRYNQRHDVTIDMTNNSGVAYSFKTHFNVREDEF